jgi:hypothetical protein
MADAAIDAAVALEKPLLRDMPSHASHEPAKVGW